MPSHEPAISPKNVTIKLLRLPHGEGLELPAYATSGAAGMDVRSAKDMVLKSGERAVVPTGFKIAIEDGYEVQMRPRSGLALKHGITLPNSPGTIDSDYRGELGVILINHGDEDFSIAKGDRIAQMVVAPVWQGACVLVDDLDDTERGTGGYGSTGKE